MVDPDRCAGHGRCYSLAPALFDCDNDGNPILLSDVVPAELLATATSAQDACPEGAISVRATP